MEINVDVYDFASEEEIKEAVLTTLKGIVRENYQKEANFDRLLTNLSYSYLFKMVDEQIDGDLGEIIREKTKTAIGDLSAFSVFRRSDAWERKESKAYEIMQDEIVKSRPLIRGRIEQIINEYPFNELSGTEISYTIAESIMDKICEVKK